MKFLALSVLPVSVSVFALPSFLSFLTPRHPSPDLPARAASTCLPAQYCVLVCNAPHFAGTCNTVCGPTGECRLIQNGLNNNVFSARTTCGAGVYFYDYRVCYNNATRLWVDQTGIDDMTGLRTYYGVRDS